MPRSQNASNNHSIRLQGSTANLVRAFSFGLDWPCKHFKLPSTWGCAKLTPPFASIGLDTHNKHFKLRLQLGRSVRLALVGRTSCSSSHFATGALQKSLGPRLWPSTPSIAHQGGLAGQAAPHPVCRNSPTPHAGPSGPTLGAGLGHGAQCIGRLIPKTRDNAFAEKCRNLCHVRSPQLPAWSGRGGGPAHC
jgi:hypothetical protein